MNKLKKIADIIIIGMAIAAVVVLGDKIIKIGKDAQSGIYFVQEQTNGSNDENKEEIIQEDPDEVVSIDLIMEIDQSLFEQRKDILAAVPEDKKKDIIEVSPGEIDNKPQETANETLKTEVPENEPEKNDEEPEDINPGQEVSGESNSDSGDDTGNVSNIDYSNSADFRIEIDLSQQRLFVFYKEDILREMVCSGGALETPTPLGEFTTIQKIEYSWVPRFEVGAYYWIRFFEDYLIHSVPFDESGEMIVEEFEKLGNPASHGCIRLRLEEAKWLYETLPLGVKVLIY
jgi:lipoprotein-anchoring transpeptidase ErfK/SrfK